MGTVRDLTPALTRLRALLAETGLTQAEFAQALGVNDSTVERWLAGATIPASRRDWLARVTLRATRGRVHLVIPR